MIKLFCVLILLASTAANAKTLVVTKGPYKQAVDDSESSMATQIVAESAATAAEQQGWNVIRANVICTGTPCLEEQLSMHSADEAIFISTEHRDDRYEFTLVTAVTKGTMQATRTGPQAQAFDVIGGMTAVHLSSWEPQSGSAEPLLQKGSTQIQTPQHSEPQPPVSRKRIKPVVFWATAAATVAMGVAWGMLESNFISKYEYLESQNPGDRNQADWNSARNLQISSRVMFGVTLGAIAATTVIGVFTDFKGENTKRDLANAPVIVPGIGGLTLKGQF